MAKPQEAEVKKPNRMDRRRKRTRSKLIEAAKVVFAKKGVDSASVHDITEEADVGIGSFYTYFPTKDEIVAGVAAERLAHHAETLAEYTARYEDPAISTVMGARTLVNLLLHEETFDWLLERPNVLVQALLVTVAPFALEDAKAAVALGKFNADVDDRRSQMMFAWGLVGFVAQARKSQMLEDADKVLASIHLRILGAEEKLIKELLELPLPKID